MKLVKVKELPKGKASKHNLQNTIQEFVNGDDHIVKVDIDAHEYKSIRVCYSCMSVAAKSSKHPIKVHIRNGVVYLEKI